MKTNPLEVIERQEIIDKLKENGYNDLVEALLGHEKKVYTTKHATTRQNALYLLLLTIICIQIIIQHKLIFCL